MHHGNVVALKIIVVKHKIHGQLESLEDRETSPIPERSVKFDQFVAVGLVERTSKPKPILLPFWLINFPSFCLWLHQ